jgi:transcriptional regulator with PAS, ATPase and Fis domain
MAEGGTLFLDEIGDITPAMQVRLLRVLQEKTFEPLGGVESVRSNVRIIAATNQNLNELISQGRFRQDLFYRIHVIHIEIPPLKDRREDIPLLIDHFVDSFNRMQGKSLAGLSRKALSALVEYDYPGNVRELQNIIEHAFVLCEGGLIGINHLPSHLRDGDRPPSADVPDRANLKSAERAMIEASLRKHRGNRSRASRELGINPSTLYRKIKALDIDVPDTDGRSKTPRISEGTLRAGRRFRRDMDVI